MPSRHKAKSGEASRGEEWNARDDPSRRRGNDTKNIFNGLSLKSIKEFVFQDGLPFLSRLVTSSEGKVITTQLVSEMANLRFDSFLEVLSHALCFHYRPKRLGVLRKGLDLIRRMKERRGKMTWERRESQIFLQHSLDALNLEQLFSSWLLLQLFDVEKFDVTHFELSDEETLGKHLCLAPFFAWLLCKY